MAIPPDERATAKKSLTRPILGVWGALSNTSVEDLELDEREARSLAQAQWPAALGGGNLQLPQKASPRNQCAGIADCRQVAVELASGEVKELLSAPGKWEGTRVSGR